MQRKILLVEDYAPNVLVAEIFIEQFGYTSDVASNGKEAVEKYTSGNYDLVLMDVQMHIMDGYDASVQIRQYEQENGLKRIPIVGMTARTTEADKARCFESGMDDYLSKPFQPDDLKETLRKFFE